MLEIDEIKESVPNGIEIVKEIFYDVINLDVVDVGIDIASTSSKVIKLIKTFADLPSQLYCKKLIRFLNGIKTIPYNKRKKFIGTFENELNNNYERILNVINNIDDEKKCDYIANAFKALVNEKIDFNIFLRLCNCIEKLISEDILFIQNNIGQSQLPYSLIIMDLVNNNLAYQTSITFTGDPSVNIYTFNSLAECLYTYALCQDKE